MTTQFGVYVSDDNGEPLDGVPVAVYWVIGGSEPEEYTDDSGWAWFNSPGEAGDANIWICGENQGEYYIDNGDEFNVVISLA